MALVLSLTMTACGSTEQPSASTRRPSASTEPLSASKRAAATRFLSRYVASDGRVIRHDQGGDIVSEGQAYAMLIAEAARQPALVRTIWSWTSAHLGRSDGLFASRATGSGQIQDPQSATDADILLAFALLRYTGPDQATLNRAGRRVAAAVLTQETVTLPDGGPLPVAGPWAKLTAPPTVDPSYLMPGVFVALARLTGDDRWSRAADTAIALIGDLTAGGHRLPPDWAQLKGDRLVAIASPSGRAGVQYGFDAERLPIWFATACSSTARRLAVSWWHNILSSNGRSGPQTLSLTGATINPSPAPLPLLAGAATAAAAGDRGAARELRARAASLARQDPTYYGDAWAALGPALIDRAISPCNETGV